MAQRTSDLQTKVQKNQAAYVTDHDQMQECCGMLRELPQPAEPFAEIEPAPPKHQGNPMLIQAYGLLQEATSAQGNNHCDHYLKGRRHVTQAAYAQRQSMAS